MSLPFLILQILATAACAVVAWRAATVVMHMDLRTRGRRYGRWLGFGLGYALLAVCAVGSLVSVWNSPMQIGYAMWPIASALLIVFDRRKRREDRA